VNELAYDELELTGGARILEAVSLVESLLGIRHRHLLGDDQRPASHGQNLAQRQQRMRRAGTPGRSAAQREHAVLICGEWGLASLAHRRNPIDRILDQWGDRGVIFRT